MRKYVLSLTISVITVLILAGCSTATPTTTPTTTPTDSTATSTTPTTTPDVDASTMSGLMMKDGEMVILMKDGSTTAVTKDMMMPNGVKVTMAGDVIDASGKKVKTLKNDEWFKSNGTY